MSNEPERVKVEPLYTKDECDADLAESMAILGTMSAKVPVAHAINIVNSMIQHLQSALSVSENSEKRAETAEREAHAQIEFMATVAKQEIAKAESARGSSQASLLRVEAERNEAKADLATIAHGVFDDMEAIRAFARAALSPHKET